MRADDEHPSQAEGEDPQRPPSGDDAPQHDHPSQAEGEDRARTATDAERDAQDDVAGDVQHGGTPEEG